MLHGLTPRRLLCFGPLAAAIAVLAVACGSAPTVTSAPATAAPATAAPATAAPASSAPVTQHSAGGKQDISLDIGGTKRTAVLVVPSDLTAPAPLVFAFHGHGGNGRNFDRKMDFESLWPEAIVVYPDGLVGHAGRTDPTGQQTGWQNQAGDTGDEDLAFYDALLAHLRATLPVDDNRIFAVGHSNGSGFVALLLNTRGAGIAATANLSGQGNGKITSDPARSMFMAMGRQDTTVPYDNQVKSIPLAEQLIGANPATKSVDGYLTTERGRGNLELAVYDYPGGHEPPPGIAPLIVAFFQRHTLSGG